MGDLLFSVAQLSRRLGVEPETALRKADDKFTARFGKLERAVTESGRTMKAMTLDELEAEWQRQPRRSALELRWFRRPPILRAGGLPTPAQAVIDGVRHEL